MVTASRVDAVVLGAGVSGLTTAVRLVEAGKSVRVLADELPHRSTSACAGASWGPYMVEEDRRIPRWCERTRLVLEEISELATSGVRLIPGIEASVEDIEPPPWARVVRGFRRCARDELPATRYVSGWRYTIPLVDMPRYLNYLIARLLAAGVVVEDERHIDSFAEVADAARVLVNCSGLGARKLVSDDDLYPIRGQLVVVENPGIDKFFQDDAEGEELTYILPHGRHVVLGGSAIPGSYDLEPDPATAEAIITRCAAIDPRLGDARVLDHLVGLRPTRPEVRVELDSVGDTPLIHNYGHGGAGLTLSWGCADEVLELSELV